MKYTHSSATNHNPVNEELHHPNHKQSLEWYSSGDPLFWVLMRFNPIDRTKKKKCWLRVGLWVNSDPNPHSKANENVCRYHKLCLDAQCETDELKTQESFINSRSSHGGQK